ncbi:MAG TPA: hypothetical protein VH138_00980 [Vicinamibacterales bacterium]|jgi:hypothetical protein|nr:hypothetical protein [Vicinamibacterales bacterium]
MLYAVGASLTLAAVMTLGDFAWAVLHIHHRTVYGIVHGAAMCLCIGIAIGVRVRRRLPAAIAGPLIGVAAAGTYYLLASPLKWGAMLPAWMILWILFALLQKLLTKRERFGVALKRGILAALLSGFAFYLTSDIWIHEARHPGMLVHFGAWAFAFLPGFASLFVQLPMADGR